MELWVRSQDKNKLVPINDELYIPNSRTGEDFGIFYKDKMLGYYKTKERAIEVLDEINKLLIPKPIISTYNVEQTELLNGTVFIKPMLDDIKIESYTSYVYQMPEK